MGQVINKTCSYKCYGEEQDREGGEITGWQQVLWVKQGTRKVLLRGGDGLAERGEGDG